ncbi:MAG: DNA helicase PcrA [Clostridia bacterium]|nr:DNA helicase PcrA [Clostridia bacterium]
MPENIDFSKLNEPQRQAVLTTEGPLLILAGAGSGKTRVLTMRIAHIIRDKGVRPYNILAITFTNKAAKEMRERLEGMLGEESKDIWVATFHSMCARILRRDIEKLGYTRSFTIYDEEATMSLIKETIKKMDLSDKVYVPKDIKYIISDAKNRMLSANEWFSQSDKDFKASRIHDIFISYENALKANNALDFDDLLIKTLELFAANPPVLDYYRRKFMYISVDEYQDTNVPQYMLVKLLSGEYGNVCVVGDDDQSIYSWRGADIRNILEFEKDFGGCTTIKLEQNYRSTGHILEAANSVIRNNFGRKQKRLWSDKPMGELVQDVTVRDERHEARLCVTEMGKLIKDYKVPPNEIAVLYRTNAQSRVIEEHLVRAGLPYRVYSGHKFYDRKEIKDIIAYMQLIANPSDEVSLLRIINMPRRGIGDVTIDMLMDAAIDNGESLCGVILDTELVPGLKPKVKASIDQFGELLTDLFAAKEMLSVDELVRKIVIDSGYKAQFEFKTDDESIARLENINELIGAVERFVSESEDTSLEAFLENVALVSDSDEIGEHGAITLMTMHSAKGLEFEHVYILGAEENIFPSNRSLTDPDRLEEERRLCYVAITRGKKRVSIVHAKQRSLYGMSQMNPPSRFLKEIDPSHKKVRDLASGLDGDTPQRNSMSSGAQAQIRRPQMPKAAPKNASFNSSFNSGSAKIDGTKSQDYKIGDKVSHPTFGNGTVIAVRGEGSKQMVKVAFENRGFKDLAAAIAPLTRL